MAFLSQQLFIRRSSIPSGGKGLFTRKADPERRADYRVQGKTDNLEGSSITANGRNGYIYFINRNHVLDAFTYRKALGRYANDARGLGRKKGLTNNAAYETVGVKVYIDATKDIPAGSEILVGYGKEYWDVIRQNKKISEKDDESEPTRF